MSGRARTRLDCLTPREWDILQLLGKGLSNAQIGECLTIEKKSVSSHITSVFAKIGATNRAQATLWLLAHPGAGANLTLAAP